ncbi:ras-related protein Rab-19-like [Engraulis encrasicolus]|uniref:ras-related protein Rab-19-like n=1 Tax=Engraulis encrasicolus TaxID=184585 RepID=UPI002FD66D1E
MQEQQHQATATATTAPETSDDTFDFLFKIILIGDSNVGKTSVVQSFKSGLFTERQHNTIGVDFTVRTLNIQGKRVKMQVWDTAGQERFRTITQSYYRSAHAALIAYDITRRATFHSVTHWLREVQNFGATNVLLTLIGNKCDLEDQRQVRFEEACSLAEENGMVAALETSAKEARNVEQVFTLIAETLLATNGMPLTSSGHPSNLLLRSNSRPISSPASTTQDTSKSCC